MKDEGKFKKAPLSELTKLKLSKSIVLLNTKFNEIQNFNITTLAMK